MTPAELLDQTTMTDSEAEFARDGASDWAGSFDSTATIADEATTTTDPEAVQDVSRSTKQLGDRAELEARLAEIRRRKQAQSSETGEDVDEQAEETPLTLAKRFTALSAPVVAIPKRFRERFPHGVNWTNVIWMAVMHAGAVAAFWHISWQAVVVCIVLHWVTACLGVTLGFHRLLTHGSLEVPRVLKYFFSICGMLSAEGSPLFWVATHRKHHVLSDLEGDPHSPYDGFWWSHMLWFEPAQPKEELEGLFQRWAPDMYRDPVQRFFHRTFILYPLLLGAVLYAAGEYFFGQGLSFLLWGLCARMVFCYHSTWLVNSATHLWGYRNYKTTDNSRNLWWVALLSYGEGWHNNHHAHQRLARHGHKWWELDPTYAVIWTLKKLGLARNVQDQLPHGTESESA